jgi:uncharacterized protein (DUF697 family)/uncharacterized tellurite resistance protein B-like protein
MAMTTEESIASLRVLICMAKADGVLHDRERQSLQVSLDEVELPGLDLPTLWAETEDLEAVLATIQDPGARDLTYSSAFAMAHTDGACSSEEDALLERMREVFEISDQQHAFLVRLFAPYDKPIVTGKLGAFPIPGVAIATDLAVAALQVALAKDIGRFWEQQMETEQARALLAGFGLGTGARIAVTNLLKIFPGWGSAAGAAAAYASTHAVGRVVDAYFERGGGMVPAELGQAFKQAKAEGKRAYGEDKETIAAKDKAHRDALASLGAQLEAGEITLVEFEQRVAALE